MAQNHKCDEIEVIEKEAQQITQSLPKATYRKNEVLLKYQSFWIANNGYQLHNILKMQRHFQARDTDIFIASIPKTGSTWLRSLLFATVNRVDHRPNVDNDQHPLSKNHPNQLVRKLEALYGGFFDDYPCPTRLNQLTSPRLFFDHMPYESLPESIKASKCRILYITRNPLDTVVSLWYFVTNMMKRILGEAYEPPSFEQFFEDFYDGRFVYGPFFENVIGYWKQSVEQPDKVMFLTYEDLKEDTEFELKRLAKFIGVPFSSEEENRGVVKQITELCSIKSLKEMEVNKSGVINKFFEKSSFFRKGEVGDWTNHFTPAMADKMKELMERKLNGTGLSFKLLPNHAEANLAKKMLGSSWCEEEHMII